MMYYGHLLEQWSLEMDLIKDLELFMKKEMQRVGINPSNTRNILYEYFNMLKRIISIRPLLFVIAFCYTFTLQNTSLSSR